MWIFVIQTLSLFLIFKFGPSILRYVGTQIRRQGRILPPPPPGKTNMDKDKKSKNGSGDLPQSQTAAVDQSAEVANQTAVATAQSALGASSAGTQAAALASLNATTSTAVATRQNEEAQAYSKFTNGLTQCMVQYQALGSWLGDQICSFMDAVDIGSIYKKFMSLSLLQKALIMIVILGIVGLLGWFTWEGVQMAWPYIVNFVTSEEGVNFLGRAGDFLQAIANSEVMKTFVRVLTNAFRSSDASNGDTPSTPCFETTQWTMLTSITAVSVLELINLFFAYMTKNAMGKK